MISPAPPRDFWVEVVWTVSLPDGAPSLVQGGEALLEVGGIQASTGARRPEAWSAGEVALRHPHVADLVPADREIALPADVGRVRRRELADYCVACIERRQCV